MNLKLHYPGKMLRFTALLAALLSADISFGQTPTVRSYATRQANTLSGIDLLGSTSSLDNAIDNDPFTASNLTIGIGVGATRTQILDFNPSPAATTSYATTIAANTPITVKFSLPAGLVSALSNLEIQAVTDLHKNGLGNWVYTAVGPTYSGSSLAGLLSGAGSQEFTITPASAYQGLRVSITGLAAVAAGVDIYDVYIKTAAPGAIVCSGIVDLLSGIRAGSVVGGIANATGGVVNQANAIDNSMTTYTTLNTGAQVLSEVYQTTIFNTQSKIGDTVKLAIQDVSSTLLNLTALAGLRLNFYNGSNGAPVQTITNDPALLTLNLLNSSGNIMNLVAVPNAVFDRVELQLGGVAGAFQSIRVYEVTRLNAGAALTNAQKDIYAYAGNSFTLSASAIATGDDVVSYYDAQTNGNLITNTTISTTMAQGGTILTYFAGTTRNGCSESSGRKQINAHIVSFANSTPVNGNVGVIYNGSVAIIPQSPNVLPLTPVYNYSTASALPPGVTLNATTGTLSGMPVTSGSFPLAVTVNDVANNVPVGTFNYTVIISTPLAVNLISFDGEAANSNIVLNWLTVKNAANKGFEIERSSEGRIYSKIGYVDGNDADGTYKFIDEYPSAGLNQYRLKIFDKEGNYTYSQTISIKATMPADIKIYPNPVVGNTLNIEGSNIINISVSNALGQQIHIPVHYTDTVSVIQTRSLSKGIYYLRVAKPGNVITIYKVVVE